MLARRYHVKCDYRLELPAGMRVERLPDKISVKSEFGEVAIEYSMSGSVLRRDADCVLCAKPHSSREVSWFSRFRERIHSRDTAAGSRDETALLEGSCHRPPAQVPTF